MIPLHVGKGKTIASALGRSVSYVENPDKTNDGELISSYECDPLIAEQQFLFSKSQYRSLTGCKQGSRDVIAYHLRQSFKPDEIEAETANKIGYDLAMSLTKGKHAFIVCTHVDKKHIHSHIIFNSTTLDCRKKFRNFWNSHIAVRKISDRLCLENGVSIIENPKKSKGKYNTWLGEKPPTLSDALRKSIDETLVTKPQSFEEFLQILKDKNIQVKAGKHIALKSAKQKKFIRLKSLGENYTEEKIRKVIEGESAHIPLKQTPTKVSLLMDVQSILNEGKGGGLAHWAKVRNAKQIANTINFLRENDLMDLEDLRIKYDEITARFHELSGVIKETESSIKDKSELRKQIYNYVNTKKIFDAYKQSKYSAKLEEKYHAEITIHRAAKKYFNSRGLKKLPNIKQLSDEITELYQLKNATYMEYKQARKDMQEIAIVKQNVNRF